MDEYCHPFVNEKDEWISSMNESYDTQIMIWNILQPL
jgi:hypothetical protein